MLFVTLIATYNFFIEHCKKEILFDTFLRPFVQFNYTKIFMFQKFNDVMNFAASDCVD